MHLLPRALYHLPVLPRILPRILCLPMLLCVVLNVLLARSLQQKRGTGCQG